MPSSVYPLEALPGMTHEYASQMSQLGLTNTQQLSRLGQFPDRCRDLAKQLNLPQRYVTKWVVLSNLARVPSVGCEYNGLLLHAGISSIDQLAHSTTQILYPRLKRLYVSTLQRSDLCPSPAQVTLWIQHAKATLNRDTRTSP